MYRVSREGWLYTIAPLPTEGAHESKMYFAGRAAQILLTKPGSAEKIRLGTFGILHPDVLKHFELQYPASCVELDLEALM